MSSKVLLTGAAIAIDQANTALDSLFAAGVAPADGKDAIMWLREVEVLRRRVDSAATLLVGVIDQRALHVDDGHASAGTMAQHVARLSGAESSARQKTAKACRDLPMLADAWSNGEIGTDQMHLLGRVHSNERVAPAMEARQDELLADANNMSAKQFEMKTRRWERLIDEDGPEPANERNHKNRNATLRPNPWDSSWDLTGFFASLQGVEMREIFDVFVEAEFQADWAEAKARLGDAVTGADLNRTRPNAALMRCSGSSRSPQPHPTVRSRPGSSTTSTGPPPRSKRCFARWSTTGHPGSTPTTSCAVARTATTSIRPKRG
nr:DUF222 domain-containing protein [Candidatus Microthrix sp.]